jgi:pyrimidine-nucleoside phosphorylase
VGNSIEVIEVIQALKGRGPEDLMKVTFALGAYMLILGKKAKNFKEAEKKLEEAIKTEKALNKFKQMVKKQGGDPGVADDYRLLPWAKHKMTVESDQTGYVKSINTFKIGLSAVKLGAGREILDSEIDPGVGFLIKKKVGDKVKKGENLAVVFSNDLKKGELAKKEIKEAYQISKRKTDRLKKILYLVDENGIKKWNN